MQAHEREDMLYNDGKRCQIKEEESYMIDLLGSPKEQGAKLLDLGCGSGEISLALQERGYSAHGVDFSASAIAIAADAGLSCEQADLDQGLSIEDGQYQVVWAGDVLEHVFDPIGVLGEVQRVLIRVELFMPPFLMTCIIKPAYEYFLDSRSRNLYIRNLASISITRFFLNDLCAICMIRAD